ncbi:MAG TPA: hypothetical protein VH598_04025 [Verrucomicrobiae bacterium]|nr:hypothetical protein [Verrucomicrobiae bacterium]
MVTTTKTLNRSRRLQSGLLMTDLIIGLGILVIALMPLAYSLDKEHKIIRASYHKAAAMEIIDGEMEILMAGEWREFKEGVQPYSLPSETAKNLPPGKVMLTITGKRIRLEWQPDQKYSGGKILREGVIK